MQTGAFLMSRVAYRLSSSLMKSGAPPPPHCEPIGVGRSRRTSEEQIFRGGIWMTSASGMVFEHAGL